CLDSADTGKVLISPERINEPGAERGLVFQDPNLFPWLTVRRNIEAGLVARGVLREKRNEVDEFMRLVGLEAFGDAYPHHLSGGMRSEEHTSELQSPYDLVCRLLLEKKKQKKE